ncbi:J domain-containing protein [Bifidobacterium aerophilum]|uniref:J domain-containing protein n=1 Tax=Bifidobacterium aerophilum TaxID=1798155 RepID=A0A6N9Z7F3_9BIFI|nr:hypothetical protein [Bifidobacterium aerophilum]NEG90376.1 hypothetical protein [Bifidobacterium aerophilum]
MAEKVNYYELLGVAREAGADEIRAAIKKQRTIWSNRASRGGTIGAEAQNKVKLIGEAEKTLLDAAARAAYDQSLNDTPEKTWVKEGERDWLQVAQQYIQDGDVKMAEAAIEQAEQQQADNPEVWDAAILIYESLDEGADWNRVERAATQAILLDPDNAFGYAARGDVYWSKDDDDRARTQYQKASELGQAQGNQAIVDYAQETLVKMDLHDVLTNQGVQLENRFNAVMGNGFISYTKETKEELASIREGCQSLLRTVERLNARVKNPSSDFKELVRGTKSDIESNIRNIDDALGGEKEAMRKPIIVNVLCLVIFFILCGVGGPIGAVLGTALLIMVMSWILTGDKIPGNLNNLPEDSFGHAIGTGRTALWLFANMALGLLAIWITSQMGN